MSDKKDLQALAQEFGLKHKLRQYVSPKGLQRAVTEMGSSKYKDRMETLREADSSMRESAVLFKDYLKSAQRAFKDNRYLDVAHWCSMVNDGVKLMMRDAKPVVDLRDSEIAEYYTRHEDANPEHNYFSADDGLVSTAGLLDKLFGNSIEKLYWKKVRESKLAVQSLISKTEKLIAITYSSLDRMGNARAHGNIGSWIEDLQRIGKAQGEFQIFAKGIYDKHLKELADIVKANKPKVQEQISAPSQSAPREIPTSDKAEEAEELVDHEPFELTNKKEMPVVEPVKEEKTGPGRPALGDPRNNKKEFEQIQGLNDLLTGKTPISNPEIKNKVEESKVAPTVPMTAPVPEVNAIPATIKEPVVAPAETPVEVPKVELPKVEVPKPVIVPPKVAPVVPQAPTQTTVDAPPKRGRGRPRKHPLPISPATNVQTVPAVSIPESISEPFSSAPVVVPSVSTPVIPKEAPVHVDIKGKEPESTPPKPFDKKIPDGKGQKITFVLIPKIIPDNLNKLQEKLEAQLSNKILYVTKANGAEKAKEYLDANWDITPITYDEAVAELSKNPTKDMRSPLELLEDPEFVASLPRLSNGDLHGGEIFGGESLDKSTGKYVRDYPQFQNLDKVTTKAIVQKMKEIDANKSSAPKIEKSIEAPKLEESKVSPIINKTPEIPAPQPEEELSEDEKEQKTFIHTGLIEKILGKSMKDVTSKDIFQLLENKSYLDSLPREKNSNGKRFDMNYISNLPEMQILKNDGADGGYSPYKLFISTLKGIESGKVPYAKTKAASNVEDALIKVANKKFYIELEKVAKTQNIGLMAALMCKYSEEIEAVNPEMSIKLLIQAGKLLD